MLHTIAASWPLSMGFFGMISVLALGFGFREPISQAIGRLKRVSRQGAELAVPDQPGRITGEAGQADELLRELDNNLLREAERRLEETLAQRQVTDPAERERVLKRYLALFAMLFQFEKIYNSIWGSQLQALNAANTGAAGNPIALDQLRSIFEQAKAQWPDYLQGDTFERWLGFLTSQELLQVTGATAKTTMKGREFLKYLIEQGRRADQKVL